MAGGGQIDALLSLVLYLLPLPEPLNLQFSSLCMPKLGLNYFIFMERDKPRYIFNNIFHNNNKTLFF